MNGIGSHQSARSVTDEWITPKEILLPLGKFDLDPCSPVVKPWDTAQKHYTIQDNGLLLPWEGRVWLNPPYGNKMKPFLKLMAEHMNGIALTFARTETQNFHRFIWPVADSMLFLEGRIIFYDIYGNLAVTKKGVIANCGGPSVLISYGEENAEALADCGLKGRHIPVNSALVIMVGISPTWKSVLKIAMNRLNGGASLEKLYATVEIIAPDKVRKNKHHREKIRQTLQRYFIRLKPAYYIN